MKLYTEEQVDKIALQVLNFGHYDASITPIELPSDEDINIQSYIHNPIKKIDGKLSAVSFIEGAKWVIEQIKQQCK